MILYLTGSTFEQVMKEVIEREGHIIFPPPPDFVGEIDFLKTVRQDIAKYEGLDMLVLDDSICKNTEDEIIEALEMLRTLYNDMRIIVFAPYREEGDDFLTRCFGMGIMNIINTNDFLQLRQELTHCIREGKSYREASKYKESKKEKVIIKHEIKRTVNKRMIGIVGVESNIGVTHNAIILANFFRKRGFMVALVEMNDGDAFDCICNDFEEKKFKEGFFTLNGVDYYSSQTADSLPEVMEHSYNVVILDFGSYEKCDRTLFGRCEDRIIIAGSKPWELTATDRIFQTSSKDALLKYIFCFNFTQKEDQDAIVAGMDEIKNVHFLKYTEDPFSETEFVDGEEIFEECLPEKVEEEKKPGVFQKILHRRKAEEK